MLLGAVGLVLVLAGATRPAAAPAPGARATSIVVTARAVPVGALLTSADIAVRSAAAAVPGVVTDESAAIGHRALVALPAGSALVPALLTASDQPAPGQRIVRVRVDTVELPPGLQSGQLVDLMAAVADGPSQAGRVVRVATGHLVSVEAGGDGTGPPGTAESTVELDVDALGAARVLWAGSFAKALSLLTVPTGDRGADGPAEVDGLAPTGGGG